MAHGVTSQPVVTENSVRAENASRWRGDSEEFAALASAHSGSITYGRIPAQQTRQKAGIRQ
jgi:hypothetical protein